MANYLVVKNGNETKSYEAKTTHTGTPYLRVGSGYLDLTTYETMTSTTFNYTGQKSATYQTVNISSTSLGGVGGDDVVAFASLSTTTRINSTYTSNGTLSVSYEDVLFSRPTLMMFASARMPYSMYTTNSSEVPYNRVVTSGYDICTATQSTTTTLLRPWDLKVKVNTTNYISTTEWFGSIQTGMFTSSIISTSYDSDNVPYGIATVQSIITPRLSSITSHQRTYAGNFRTTSIDYDDRYIGLYTIGTSSIVTLTQSRIRIIGQYTTDITFRPKEYYTTTLSTSTASTALRYIWNSSRTTSSSVTTTTSITNAQGASYCQTWIGSKVTFSVNITSTNGNTGTGTVTRNYVSMVATQSNEDIMRSMGSRLNSISNSYFSVDKSSDKPISASYFISHTRKHSGATSENAFNRSANTTTSNATTAYLFSDTATSSTLITKIYPRSLESGSWTCTDYAVGEYKRTYSDINGNVVTKADGLVSISRVNISRTIAPVSSTTTLVTETNYYHDFTFTTNSSRTFSITNWKGTASLYTVSDNNRRYSQTMTYVNGYTNRSSTQYDSVSYSLVESTTTSLATTISSTTEL